MTELRATSADGTLVTALDDGSGPALLLVHGGGEDPGSWDGVTAALVEDFRVVRINRRIYADGAPAAGAAHSCAVEAADVLAVAAALGQPALLVGHSSGAIAALEAALVDPSAFRGLFLYEPPVPSRSQVGGVAAVRATAALEAGDATGAVRIQLRDIVGLPAAQVETLLRDPGTRRLLTRRAAAQAADIRALDALGVGTGRFTGLRLPATLLEGGQSPAHLRERLADLAAALPDAQVVTLPGCGHTAHRSAPRTVARKIREAAVAVLGLPGGPGGDGRGEGQGVSPAQSQRLGSAGRGA
ncbi:alpha/beta fold hydrolase [Kitasatospora sp. NPDC088346]|uniref:alpha/beta fold hydrolase n=1 Tax=Kitasatospora sp. NPDC088346 TaxID=3364073 RepID=UPI003828216D